MGNPPKLPSCEDTEGGHTHSREMREDAGSPKSLLTEHLVAGEPSEGGRECHQPFRSPADFLRHTSLEQVGSWHTDQGTSHPRQVCLINLVPNT